MALALLAAAALLAVPLVGPFHDEGAWTMASDACDAGTVGEGGFDLRITLERADLDGWAVCGAYTRTMNYQNLGLWPQGDGTACTEVDLAELCVDAERRLLWFTEWNPVLQVWERFTPAPPA